MLKDRKASMKAYGVVRQFEKAVRDHEMLGAAHPKDRLIIEANLSLARNQLMNFIKQLELEASF